MMSLKIFALVSFFAIVLLASFGDAQTINEEVTLQGRLVHYNGSAIGSVTVTAKILDGITELNSTTNTTNTAGVYHIAMRSPLTVGKTYTVNVSAQGSYLTQRFIR